VRVKAPTETVGEQSMQDKPTEK